VAKLITPPMSAATTQYRAELSKREKYKDAANPPNSEKMAKKMNRLCT
jgi:hypothetical protein